MRLDLDFTDTTSPYAYVVRVDALTGAPTAVRTHGVTTSIGGVVYSNMQAGFKAVLYDSECPMDTAVYYTATSVQAPLNVNTDFEDGFYEPWVSQQATNTLTMDYDPTFDPPDVWSLSFHSDGATASPQLRSEPCPSLPGTTLTASVRLSVTNGSGYTVGIQYLDATQAVLSGASNSFTGTSSVQVSTFTGVAPASTVFARVFIQLTGTPASNIIANVSQASLYAPAGTATSTPVLVSSLGSCWLKDPLQPANNVRVDFCFDPNPLCIPKEGVFFQSLDAETMPANSAAFNINNQANPVVVSKIRSSDQSTLTLVSRTFPDRDRLRTLLAPGTPLLWQVPDEYGSPDRYVSIGAVTITRTLPDHRIPIRIFSNPFVVVDAPGGPSAGVLGVRWQDMCNRYATWGAVNAAGITWTGVLDGLAG